MKVYKFGGASVKDSDAIKNLGQIILNEGGELVVIVSALGKTTNKLEILTDNFLGGSKDVYSQFKLIRNEHLNIIGELFKKDHSVFVKVNDLFEKLFEVISKKGSGSYDFTYDQIVHFGELISTTIINEYLKLIGLNSKWVNIKDVIKTDSTHRDGNVLFDMSKEKAIRFFNFDKCNIYVSQGFIAEDLNGNPVTLGREGSDYSAALLANFLDAESLSIWKDVPGVLNADPKYFENTKKIDELSYLEAIELAYSGAQVIHPKTIKPLQNKQIPLYVRSFITPKVEGTVIKNDHAANIGTPICIVKRNQLLLTLKPLDYSFVLEEGISKLISLFFENNIKVNLIQTSAISFSISVDNEKRKIEGLLESFKNDYKVLYNDDLELYTIRHYNKEYLEYILGEKEILLEQRSRSSVRYVLKK